MIDLAVTIANKDITLLAPLVQEKLATSILVCHEIGYPVVVTEGYRTPQRQNFLYEQGRSRPGAIITKKKAWGSFHNVGCALDICFVVNGKWSWDKDLPWEKTAKVFQDHGFQWLFPFEKCHFQITSGMSIYEASKIYQTQGPQVLWQKMGLV